MMDSSAPSAPIAFRSVIVDISMMCMDLVITNQFFPFMKSLSFCSNAI